VAFEKAKSALSTKVVDVWVMLWRVDFGVARPYNVIQSG